MSTDGCDNFNAVWDVALNVRRYQRRKERLRRYLYPGLCPLDVPKAAGRAVAGVMVHGVTWLDALAV